jgi:hypothetical protein
METPHAVASTGAKSQPLPGGRSRRTANGVPVLELSNSSVEKVAEAQGKLLDPHQESVYLTGATAYLHTPVENSHGGPDVVIFHIGGETLDEAAKSCVGAFEDSFSNEPPTWVASTDDDLAEVLADHYGCPIKGMDEELSA